MALIANVVYFVAVYFFYDLFTFKQMVRQIYEFSLVLICRVRKVRPIVTRCSCCYESDRHDASETWKVRAHYFLTYTTNLHCTHCDAIMVCQLHKMNILHRCLNGHHCVIYGLNFHWNYHLYFFLLEHSTFQSLIFLSTVSYVGCYQFMAHMAKTKYSESGQLLDSGLDLNMEGGVAEWVFALIINNITIFTHVTETNCFYSQHIPWRYYLSDTLKIWLYLPLDAKYWQPSPCISGFYGCWLVIIIHCSNAVHAYKLCLV